jgi:hypothetical protein
MKRALTALAVWVACNIATQAHAERPATIAASDAQPYPLFVLRRPFSLYIGAQAGSVMPGGLMFLFETPRGDHLGWDVDLTWEPSHYLQSYSAALNYHFLDSAFFLGGRLRYMQMHPPFSRGFQPSTDHQLAFGPELGARWLVDGSRRFILFVSIGASFFPGQTLDLPPLYTLNIGFALGVARFRH